MSDINRDYEELVKCASLQNKLFQEMGKKVYELARLGLVRQMGNKAGLPPEIFNKKKVSNNNDLLALLELAKKKR